MTDGNVTGSIAHSLASGSAFLSMLILLCEVGFVFVVLGLVSHALGEYGETETDYSEPETEINLPAWNCPNCGGPNPGGSELCEYCGKALLDLEQAIKFEKTGE